MNREQLDALVEMIRAVASAEIGRATYQPHPRYMQEEAVEAFWETVREDQPL